jgi:hypothetical protein
LDGDVDGDGGSDADDDDDDMPFAWAPSEPSLSSGLSGLTDGDKGGSGGSGPGALFGDLFAHPALGSGVGSVGAAAAPPLLSFPDSPYWTGMGGGVGVGSGAGGAGAEALAGALLSQLNEFKEFRRSVSFAPVPGHTT